MTRCHVSCSSSRHESEMQQQQQQQQQATVAQLVLEGRRPWYDAEGITRQPIIIGIGGGSASGKATICNEVVRMLIQNKTTDPQWCLIIGLDCFYKDLPREQLTRVNDVDFDRPDAIDYDALVQTLLDLKDGKTALVPKWDFETCQRTGTKKVYGADVILVEGALVFNNKKLLELFDIKLFVDTDDDIRLSRRLRRDVKERGRSVESVLQRYERFVKPAFLKYILPTKKIADIIVPTSDKTEVVIDLIFKRIDKELRERNWYPQLEEVCDATRPKNLYVLPENPQIKALQTILMDRETSHDDFVFHSDRLVSLVIEHALTFLPYHDLSVETPTGSIYKGKQFIGKPCGVSIMPAGCCMEGPLRRVCKGIRLGKILIQSNKERGPSLIYVKLPKVMAERTVLLVNPMLYSGATLTMAARVLIDHGVPQENILFLTLIAYLPGVQLVMKQFPNITFITALLDTSPRGDKACLVPPYYYHSGIYFGQ
eukprot:TRINITY_DN2120_c5_g1_i1.p1 TRINITY_DN2120_c5_g1~~TRINITY_DN2120_c5_g1_i1.p1  ORF type:complete len:503 (+),score=156.16 TRINITY_DN2120_c5_g1_i1:60-1511(+)